MSLLTVCCTLLHVQLKMSLPTRNEGLVGVTGPVFFQILLLQQLSWMHCHGGGQFWGNPLKVVVDEGMNERRYMGVSKNQGTPKWMVYNGKPSNNG